MCFQHPVPIVELSSLGGCTMGGDRHSGDDDKKTDHVGGGSDGHTVESGDDK